MPIRTVAAALALVFALAAGGALLAVAPADARLAENRCDRRIDLGFTTATVYARHMTCVRARQVVQRWLRKVSRNGDGPAPRRTRVVGYTCRFGGSELLLRVRCTKGRKRAKATWGG